MHSTSPSKCGPSTFFRAGRNVCENMFSNFDSNFMRLFMIAVMFMRQPWNGSLKIKAQQTHWSEQKSRQQ